MAHGTEFDESTAEGAFATIAALAEVEDLDHVGDAYRETMRAAYWDDKDVHIVVAVAYAGVSRLLTEAARVDVDDETEYALRSAAKGLTYDLASFAWIGWDEAGIELSSPERSAGLAAARTNLSMAYALDKGDLPISRAHWMLGAHLLTAGDLVNATGAFEEASRHATLADEPADAALGDAFRALANLAADPAAEPQFLDAMASLRSVEGGSDLAPQVDTARRVIGA
ncbi:MAG: hypothetical protein ACR2NG_06990 [Acidimicrobiia bacterium]